MLTIRNDGDQPPEAPRCLTCDEQMTRHSDKFGEWWECDNPNCPDNQAKANE